jgi:hypothetical protein
VRRHIKCLIQRVKASIRQQGNVAGAFYCLGQRSLVTGTCAGLTPRLDLASLRNKAAKPAYVFVVNIIDLVDTKLAYLSPRCVAKSGARPAAAHGRARTRARLWLPGRQ